LTAPTNGSYIVHLRSVDQDGNVVQEVNIANVSLEGSPGKGSAPVLDLTWPDGVVQAGDEVPFLASASDPDGDPVEVWWDMDLSDGLGLDGAGNSINWTYALGGNTSVLCIASDGSHLVVKEIPIHIIEPEVNRDPVANMTWSRPRGLVVRFDASDGSADPDGDRLQYRFNFGDGNMTGWRDDPVVEHDYPWSGIFTASLKVRDRRGGESDRSFHDMELFEIPNRAPVLAIPDGVEMIERGSSFTLWLNGSHDPDQDHLTVIVSWGDGSSETFVFDGTIDRPMNHTYGRDGRYTIDVSVSDGTTNATSGELDVRVSDGTDDGNFDPLLVILIVVVLVIIVALFAIIAISAILFTRSRRGKDEE